MSYFLYVRVIYAYVNAVVYTLISIYIYIYTPYMSHTCSTFLITDYTYTLTHELLYYIQMAYQSKCGHIFCYICIIPLISHTRNKIIAKPVGTAGGTVGKGDRMVKVGGSTLCPVCGEVMRGVKRWDGRGGRS